MPPHPQFCTPQHLVDSVRPRIRSSTALLHELDGSAGTVLQEDPYTSTGMVAYSQLGSPHPPRGRASSSLNVFVQTRRYALTKTTAASPLPATSITGLLRTETIWIDRQRLHVAFQLKDTPACPLACACAHAAAPLRSCNDKC